MRNAIMITAGVDVGGPKKGFHAIALRNRTIIGQTSSCNATEIATWCRDIRAEVVAVDAPIGWSKSGRARPAERALMQQGIWCFSTPTKKAAKSHSTNHFGWMLQGAKLYRALDKSFARFSGSNERIRPICFETFPHAIACALNGAPVSAQHKGKVRRALLAKATICCDFLTNIDFVDAALCALAAEHFAHRRYVQHGDGDEGCIVVPRLASNLCHMGSRWYQRLRSVYRPSPIRILLIGESPPDPRSSQRRFFYSPVLKADNLYRGVAMALYGRERGFDFTRKVDNLARMKRDGVWLVDAVNTPINLKTPAERKQTIRDGVPRLVRQVKKAAPSLGVIICHGLVYRECAPALRDAKICVLHDEALPFPLGNTRARFVAGMCRALARAARRKD